MNIEASKINTTAQTKKQSTNQPQKDSSVKFADELKDLETTKDSKEMEETKSFDEKDIETTNTNEPEKEKDLNKSLEELNSIVEELNQSDEKKDVSLKINKTQDDNTIMINNDFNISDNKDILPQMNPNMNFSGDGQPFSSFMGNENNSSSKDKLSTSAADLAEEAAILSTMAENIAIANKNTIIKDSEKVVNREEGIKKVDTKTGITIENVVKYDAIIMNEADVEVFAELANKGEVNLNNLAPEAAQKSVKVSKTLADMLAKAKDSGQPLRIDFDNGISVIIKISREGKVRADFLPSTQVAEAYLKENLPLLKQRFDEKNLDYDSLNQRERREQNKEDNKKKGRRDE